MSGRRVSGSGALSSQGSGLQSVVTHATGGYTGSFCTGLGKLPCWLDAAPTLRTSASAVQHKIAARNILVTSRGAETGHTVCHAGLRSRLLWRIDACTLRDRVSARISADRRAADVLPVQGVVAAAEDALIGSPGDALLRLGRIARDFGAFWLDSYLGGISPDSSKKAARAV
jgi:hypothetical protein